YAYELQDLDGTALRIVHRDVSPQNILIGYDGRTKLADFGIAKAANSAVETRTGVIKGKMTYMSPEQAVGDLGGNTADVYSVGVILWEAIAGRRRWKGMDHMAVYGAVVSGERPHLPGAASKGLPPIADEIAAKALAPRPSDRFASAEAFK